jgi:hypothetical protein
MELRFERREALIVPQTPRHVALHADVFFAAAARDRSAAVIQDAYLDWIVPSGNSAPKIIRRVRWDRAVLGGRFLYPSQALEITLDRSAVAEVTLTFTDGLIGHEDGTPPAESTLTLELHLAGGRRQSVDLWRVRMNDWLQPRADLEWLR